MESPNFISIVRPLSALIPIEFTYSYNKEEKLTKDFYLFNNGLSYCTHAILSGLQDISLSKKNLLALTNKLSLYDVFDTDSTQIKLGTIAGSIYIKSQGTYVTFLREQIYLGGKGERLPVTISPVEGQSNLVELIINKTYKITIDEEYPYTARLYSDYLRESKLYRQRFEIDYADDKISIRTKTKEGWRFLSYGVDNVIRAIGLHLNEVKINPYVFDVEPITNSSILYDFNAKNSEVEYFNELTTANNLRTLNIKEESISNTHLLVSCSTSVIGLSSKVPINISLTKTNFSSTGSYLTKP
jgi:hypothetical protein